jgi:signal transduction histidine kinase
MAVLSVLVIVVLGALAVPLAFSYARSTVRSAYLDRAADASQFAALASTRTTKSEEEDLKEEFRSYQDLYGIGVVLVDTTGAPSVRSRPEVAVDADTDTVRTALGGRPSNPPEQVWPWQDDPLVVAVPVVRNGDVIGAVVTVSPTDRVRTAVALYCAGLVLVVGAALAGGLWLAYRTTGWMLQPVARLDHAATEVATGQYGRRVDASTGPPELRRLANVFNQMVGELEAAIARQRAFVADASHQLRNPLHALMLRIGDLRTQVPPRLAEDVEAAEEDARYLNRILDSLLHLAKAEHRLGPAEQVDVVDVVRSRVAAWAPAAAGKHLAVQVEAPARALVVARVEDLSGAVDVLLDNAIKFSPDGGTICVRLHHPWHAPDRGWLRVSVADCGPGVAEDELARLGDRFWRSPQHQNVPGSGLGLAIARELVQRHGGRLTAEVNDPVGLMLHLDLPAVSGEPSPVAEELPQRSLT